MLFVPCFYVNSIYDLTPQTFFERGLKGVILDIDNTLVGRKEYNVSDRLLDWVNSLKSAGLRVAIVSNGKKKRVEYYANSFKVYNVHSAFKPLRWSFDRAAERLELKHHELAVIGDQIFTDILGGNSLGMYTILVNPVGEGEGFFFRLRRLLEEPFIYLYNRKHKDDRRAQ